MRLYDCFEIQDTWTIPDGKPLKAFDLRFNQEVMLHRWRTDSSTLVVVQDRAHAICESFGFELFSDDSCLWLVETPQKSAEKVLAQLRAENFFPVDSSPSRNRCVQCHRDLEGNKPLCDVCASQRALPAWKKLLGKHLAYPLGVAVLCLIAWLVWPRVPSRPPQAPGAKLTLDRSVIKQGECVELTWSSLRGSSAEITPGRPVDLDGHTKECPKESTTYRFTVTGLGGVATQNATVDVVGKVIDSGLDVPSKLTQSPRQVPAPFHVEKPLPPAVERPPTVMLTAVPSTLVACQESSLRWTVTGNYKRLTLREDSPEQRAVANIAPGNSYGSYSIYPLRPSFYRAVVSWSGGEVVSPSTEVTVGNGMAHGPPACGEIIWTGLVPDNGQVTMRWSTDGAKSEPAANSPIIGSIPHWRVRMISEDSSVQVVSQPAELREPMVVLSCRSHGLTTLRLRWSLQS